MFIKKNQIIFIEMCLDYIDVCWTVVPANWPYRLQAIPMKLHSQRAHVKWWPAAASMAQLYQIQHHR